MKNIIHAIASLSFVTWAIGVFAYDVNMSFHYLLAVSVFAAVIRVTMEKKLKRKTKKTWIG